MKSFHGDKRLKKDMLAEISKHEKADAIIQGTYGEEDAKGKWRGCAIGCSIKSLCVIKGKEMSTSDHSLYEKELGIPRILARLEDRIFEGLDKKDAKKWPKAFIKAIPVGADLSMVWPEFIIFVLVDKRHGVIKFAKTDAQRKSIQDVADCYKRVLKGEKVDVNEWLEKRKNAAAAAAAYAAAAYAAYAAAAAAAARKSFYKVLAAKMIDILKKQK